MNTQLQRVAILGSVRTAFTKPNTGFSDETSCSLLSAVLGGMLKKLSLPSSSVEMVIGGAVFDSTHSLNLMRDASLNAGFKANTQAVTLQMADTLGLQALIILAQKIALGEVQTGIAAGADCFSARPVNFSGQAQKSFSSIKSKDRFRDKLNIVRNTNLAQLIPSVASDNDQRTGLSKAEISELVARQCGITRQEQDDYALASFEKAEAAITEGHFIKDIVPHAGMTADTLFSSEDIAAHLALDTPLYSDRLTEGSVTQTNLGAAVDGGVAIMLASEKWALEHDREILGYITAHAIGSANYLHGNFDQNNLVETIGQVLERSGKAFNDISLYELHEESAVFTIAALRSIVGKHGISEDETSTNLDHLGSLNGEVNPFGSSIAFGSAGAATSLRILQAAVNNMVLLKKNNTMAIIPSSSGVNVVVLVEA